MDAILWEWMSLAIRWIHVIAGIAWIGSSFYFIHTDLSLKPREGLPKEAYGDTWQVHGGGFYNLTKYLVAPPQMPAKLTWFKWEAYATWFSGVAMLIVVYYLNADLYLIDKNVMDLKPWQAVAISVATLMAGWIIYDGLCRSPIGKNMPLLGLAGFLFLVLFTYLSTLVFSARGAFTQIGALIGSMMVANVLMVIIPGQRKVVASLIAGETPDPIHGFRGKQRSVHNNYLTLPVVFIMIGNHYPLAYATRYSWVIVALVIVMGAVIRHFYNERHAGRDSPWWTWGFAAVLALLVVWVSTLGPAQGKRVELRKPVRPIAFSQVDDIVTSRCSMCHAAQPVWAGITIPPKGIMLDTPERIRAYAGEIAMQSVHSSAMPPGNITGLEHEERVVLAAWLAGARK